MSSPPFSFLQILDSRGNPTVAGLWTGPGGPLRIAVPSGASTGRYEARELRDGEDVFGGRGVRQAVRNAHELASRLAWDPADVRAADAALLAADGTPGKERLGANALLAVSLLQASVQARQRNVERYALLAELAGTQPALPVPFANILNGGRHAGTRLRLQEFMIVPRAAGTFAEATQHVSEVYHALRKLLAERFGAAAIGLGDEGGFAPDIATAEEACRLLVDAAASAGRDVAIAIDAAASEFFTDGAYTVAEGVRLSAGQLREWYLSLLRAYPIVSIEDPFDQEDFASFAALRSRIAEEGLACQVVGDDLTVTNPERIRKAAEVEACDCLLVKMNQIGTVSETLSAVRLASESGWRAMVSHRSGETEDTFIADLATGLGCGQIKLGAPARGERTAKYNRLLEIEERFSLPFAALPVQFKKNI